MACFSGGYVGRRLESCGMIQVKITPNSIEMNGHAGCSKNGQDIVCAAISTLTCNLINSISTLTKTTIQTKTGSALTWIAWNKLDERASLLIDSWYLGISAINEQYHCILFA